MAGTSGCSLQLEKLKLSGASGTMGGSDDVTAPASEAGRATPSLSFESAEGASMMMEGEKSGERGASTRSVQELVEQSKAHWSVLADTGAIEEENVLDHATAAAPASEAGHATTSTAFYSAVEEQIERSKSHWSTLVDKSGCMEGEGEAEVDNVEVFKALQWHPTWGDFFGTFGYDLNGGRYGRMGELVMGEKFAEGGQAELYEAHVKWHDPRNTEEDVRKGREYALKVFKKGTFLRDLQLQLPQGLLRFIAEDIANWSSPTPKLLPRFHCFVNCGILLKDGRFAFLMVKEHFDLRNLIERSMKSKINKDCGPFSKEEAEVMMYDIALGVDWLHGHDIVHRDLKASNVLVQEFETDWSRWVGFVADYECSAGVVGTGFFRAPEILQACKERKISQRPEVFSTSADIYSYGMICYEILTGKLPFEDHPLANECALLTDLVINQKLRPEVPEYVDDWTHELLDRCWQSNPVARPTIGEILNLLPANSATVRGQENFLMKRYGENYRSNVKLDIEIPNSGS